MEVMISVCGETPHIGEVFHCGDAYATVVSVDTKGNPVELPFELIPDSPADKLRCAGAADRSVFDCPTWASWVQLRLIAVIEIGVLFCLHQGNGLETKVCSPQYIKTLHIDLHYAKQECT